MALMKCPSCDSPVTVSDSRKVNHAVCPKCNTTFHIDREADEKVSRTDRILDRVMTVLLLVFTLAMIVLACIRVWEGLK